MPEISPHVYCISFTIFFVLILLYIIQSHDFCIQNSDNGGDRFTFTIYPDSIGCNTLGTECSILD